MITPPIFQTTSARQYLPSTFDADSNLHENFGRDFNELITITMHDQNGDTQLFDESPKDVEEIEKVFEESSNDKIKGTTLEEGDLIPAAKSTLSEVSKNLSTSKLEETKISVKPNRHYLSTPDEEQNILAPSQKQDTWLNESSFEEEPIELGEKIHKKPGGKLTTPRYEGVEAILQKNTTYEFVNPRLSQSLSLEKGFLSLDITQASRNSDSWSASKSSLSQFERRRPVLTNSQNLDAIAPALKYDVKRNHGSLGTVAKSDVSERNGNDHVDSKEEIKPHTHRFELLNDRINIANIRASDVQNYHANNDFSPKMMEGDQHRKLNMAKFAADQERTRTVSKSDFGISETEEWTSTNRNILNATTKQNAEPKANNSGWNISYMPGRVSEVSESLTNLSEATLPIGNANEKPRASGDKQLGALQNLNGPRAPIHQNIGSSSPIPSQIDVEVIEHVDRVVGVKLSTSQVGIFELMSRHSPQLALEMFESGFDQSRVSFSLSQSEDQKEGKDGQETFQRGTAFEEPPQRETFERTSVMPDGLDLRV